MGLSGPGPSLLSSQLPCNAQNVKAPLKLAPVARRTFVPPAALRSRTNPLLSACLSRGSRISFGGIFRSFLFVLLATLAAGSTFVALRMGEDRKLAREELSRATKTIDQMTAVVSNNGLLKGSALEPARQELLQPVLEYNQAIVTAHATDKVVTGEATAAKFRIAALQAKLGSKDSVETLGDAINMLCTMNENPATDLDTFPSLHANLLKIAAPTDWMAVKGATFEDMRNHGLKLYFDLVGGVGALKSLHEKHPQSINFTDDLAALLTSLATLKATDSRPARRRVVRLVAGARFAGGTGA